MNPKRPKITPSQLNLFTEPVTEIYRALETQIFEMVAKRLKTSKNITSDTVFEWQVDKMNQLRLVNEDTVKALSQATGKSEKAIRKAIKDTRIISIESVDHELKDIYDTLPTPSHIDNIIESYVNQT